MMRRIKVVRELVGGKPIGEIPVSMISDIIIVIEDQKKAAISNGQVDRLKRLQNISSGLLEMDQKRKIIVKKKIRIEK